MTLQPSDHLFALLDFCGVRQRDIVQHLGVSKALVSQWYRRRLNISAHHHAALVQYVEARFWQQQDAWQAACAPRNDPASVRAMRQKDVHQFSVLHRLAQEERSLEGLYWHLATTVRQLTRCARTQDTIPWDEARLTEVEGCAQRILTTVGFIRGMRKEGSSLEGAAPCHTTH